MKLSTLAKELKTGELRGDAEIASLCTDSRVAGQGDLFFCYRGTHGDSHTYAEEAVRRGAAAIVCERALPLDCAQLIVPNGRESISEIAAAFYGHPERDLKVIGVTGTNGKTTVTHMLYHILTAAGESAGLIGTLGVRYANKKIAPVLTTPDPVFLFSLLDDMRKEGVKYAVMEVSAHALALKKELPICYEVGIFTNLSQDHLDFFKTMQAYGEAKKSMFEGGRCLFSVLNADDPFHEQLKSGEYTTFGLETPADHFAVVESETIRGSRAMLNLADELCDAEINMTGRYNISNALAAAVAAKRLGISVEDIASGLKATKVDGRLEHVGSFHGAEIFVDFAHTPDGLEKSLSALKEHCNGRLLCLFGCGGNRDAGKREKMGEAAAKLCDFCIITSDNPRYEDPCSIISQIEQGFRPLSKQYVAVETREKATEYALKMLSKDDVLLVAGKGGETYQEIMGIKYSYNDKDVIRAIIEKSE